MQWDFKRDFRGDPEGLEEFSERCLGASKAFMQKSFRGTSFQSVSDEGLREFWMFQETSGVAARFPGVLGKFTGFQGDLRGL